MATVDRVLEDGRLRRERSSLQHQLTQANADLEHRLRELTTLSSIGKAVVNLSDVGSLFNRILESALLVTSAEMGWMVLTDEGSDQTLLVGAKNFPGRVQLLQPWDDGLIPLVKVSGEPLNLSGAGLASLKIGQITKAVLAVPLKAREQTIGVLTVAHKTAQPFTDRHTVLLNAVADYASIAIVNMRLFEALEGRARSMQQAYEELQAGDKRRNEVMWKLSQALRGPVGQAKSILDLNLTEIGAKLKEQQRNSLKNASEKLTEAWQMLEDLAIVHEPPRATTPTLKPVKLDELARQSLAKHQPLAQQNNITLLTSIAAPIIVPGDQARLLRIFDCLIGNAIKFSLKGSEVVVKIAASGVCHSDVHIWEGFFDLGNGRKAVSKRTYKTCAGKKRR